jgi:hypothetical protein
MFGERRKAKKKHFNTTMRFMKKCKKNAENANTSRITKNSKLLVVTINGRQDIAQDDDDDDDNSD